MLLSLLLFFFSRSFSCSLFFIFSPSPHLPFSPSPLLSVSSPRYGRRPRTKATARVLWLAGRAVAILPEIFLAGIFARQMASAHTYLEHKLASGASGASGGGMITITREAPKLLSFLDAGREFLSDVGNTGDAFSSSSSSLFSSSSSSSPPSATWGTWGRALVNGGDSGISSGILGLPWWRVAHAFFQGTTHLQGRAFVHGGEVPPILLWCAPNLERSLPASHPAAERRGPWASFTATPLYFPRLLAAMAFRQGMPNFEWEGR